MLQEHENSTVSAGGGTSWTTQVRQPYVSQKRILTEQLIRQEYIRTQAKSDRGLPRASVGTTQTSHLYSIMTLGRVEKGTAARCKT